MTPRMVRWTRIWRKSGGLVVGRERERGTDGRFRRGGSRSECGWGLLAWLACE